MFKEDIKNIKSTTKELKQFGIYVGMVLAAISVVMIYYSNSKYPYFLIIGISLIVLGIILPKTLKPIYKPWMILALVIGWFSSRIILTILFFFVLTPIGLIAKLVGKDFLDKKFVNLGNSYWNYRARKPYDGAETERQF